MSARPVLLAPAVFARGHSIGWYAVDVLRVVLDTSVVTTALRSREGASFALLQAVRWRKLVPIASPSLFFEYEEVLKRAEQRRASGLDLTDVDDFLSELAALIDPVDVHLL